MNGSILFKKANIPLILQMITSKINRKADKNALLRHRNFDIYNTLECGE
jgi:hypothetical protein